MTVPNTDPATDPDDKLQVRGYQDELDTDDEATDPIMDEESDDPTKDLGVDPKEFKAELDKYDFDDDEEGDDRREQLEDLDEDDDTGEA